MNLDSITPTTQRRCLHPWCIAMLCLQEAGPAPYLDIQESTQEETEDAECCQYLSKQIVDPSWVEDAKPACACMLSGPILTSLDITTQAS